jgi:hypothetical protein
MGCINETAPHAGTPRGALRGSRTARSPAARPWPSASQQPTPPASQAPPGTSSSRPSASGAACLSRFPPPRTKWTRRVHHLVLIGRAPPPASFSQVIRCRYTALEGQTLQDVAAFYRRPRPPARPRRRDARARTRRARRDSLALAARAACLAWGSALSSGRGGGAGQTGCSFGRRTPTSGRRRSRSPRGHAPLPRAPVVSEEKEEGQVAQAIILICRHGTELRTIRWWCLSGTSTKWSRQTLSLGSCGDSAQTRSRCGPARAALPAFRPPVSASLLARGLHGRVSKRQREPLHGEADAARGYLRHAGVCFDAVCFVRSSIWSTTTSRASRTRSSSQGNHCA